jgi:uncharacterized protein YkwD
LRHARVLLACSIALLLPLAAAGEAGASAAGNHKASAFMVKRINKLRGRHGLHPVRASKSLNGSTARFSHWLMAHDAFAHRSHVSADQRFKGLGEVLAMHTGHAYAGNMTARQWLGSPVHRNILLNPSLHWIGAGVSRGNFRGGAAVIWCVQVATGR